MLLDAADGGLRSSGAAGATAAGTAAAAVRLAARLENVVERLVELSGRHDGGCCGSDGDE